MKHTEMYLVHCPLSTLRCRVDPAFVSGLQTAAQRRQNDGLWV